MLTRLLILLGLLSFAAYTLWVFLERMRRPPKQRDPLARAASQTAIWRGAGALLGALLALRLAYAPPSWHGLGVALAAPAFALCVLAGVLAGEASVRAAQGEVRQAALGVRQARTSLPVWPTRLVAALTAALVVILVGGGIVGGLHELGRQLTLSSGSAGPWPGLFYGLPLGVVVIAGYAAAFVVLRWIVRRPRPTASTVELDDALRTRSAEVVVAAVGLLVASSLAGSAYFAGQTMLSVSGADAWVRLLGILALLIAFGAFLASAWCLSVLLLPRSAMPRRLAPAGP